MKKHIDRMGTIGTFTGLTGLRGEGGADGWIFCCVSVDVSGILGCPRKLVDGYIPFIISHL